MQTPQGARVTDPEKTEFYQTIRPKKKQALFRQIAKLFI
jgi:hypothetical protein